MDRMEDSCESMQTEGGGTSSAPLYAQYCGESLSHGRWLPPAAAPSVDSLSAGAPTHFLAAAAGRANEVQLWSVDWRAGGAESAAKCTAERLRETVVQICVVAGDRALAVCADGCVHMLHVQLDDEGAAVRAADAVDTLVRCNGADYYKEVLVLAGSDGALKTLDMRTQRVKESNAAHWCSSILCVAVTGHNTVATGNVSGSVHVWDERAGRHPAITIAVAASCCGQAISAMDASRVSPHLLSVGTQSGDVALLDTRKAATVCHVALAQDMISEIKVDVDSPSSGVAVSEDGSLCAWSAPQGLESAGRVSAPSASSLRPCTGVPLRSVDIRGQRLLAAGLCNILLAPYA